MNDKIGKCNLGFRSSLVIASKLPDVHLPIISSPQIDETRHPFPRSALVHHSINRVNVIVSPCRAIISTVMSVTKHLPVDLPVFHKPFLAVWVIAQKMFRMIPPPRMINSAGAFYRLTTGGSSTQRVVGFVVMVCTKRLPIKDIEFLVGEWLLAKGTWSGRTRIKRMRRT